MRIKGVLLYFTFILLLACNRKDEYFTYTRPHLTVVTSIMGLGDMGYNDMIMSGIMNFYNDYDVAMNMFHPDDKEEVEKIISEWCLSTANVNYECLLLLADNTFINILRSMNICLNNNQKIMVFESRCTDLPKGVFTFDIDRYGVSYLAGCMAMEHSSATAVVAMPGDDILERAVKGFKDGYCSRGNRDFKIIYIADDESGFYNSGQAYKIASELSNTFIFPVAGGANSGIYKYSREEFFYMPLIAGFDVDCSLFSTRIPFSVVIAIDDLVYEYLKDWIEGGDIKPYCTYGLESGKADIVVSDIFFENSMVFEDYYFDPDFWNDMYVKYKNEAISIEIDYEND